MPQLLEGPGSIPPAYLWGRIQSHWRFRRTISRFLEHPYQWSVIIVDHIFRLTDKFYCSAAFAYANVQIVGVAGAETINSRVAIPKAVRRTYVRIVLFYVLSIFVLGLIVPSTSAALFQSDGTAATAPFVIAIKAAGIKVLPSIVNAVVLTSAFSSVSVTLLAFL